VASGEESGAKIADGGVTGIYLGASSQANVYGSFDGISLASGDSLGAYGGSNTISSGPVEVPDSASFDIRIGFGLLDTESTGILGLTRYSEQGGELEPGVVVRLEDPNQTAIGSGATGGQATYAGTQADLYQDALHELGHALGLGDNPDPDSVMYYGSSSTNRQLDATDASDIQALYGSVTSASQSTGRPTVKSATAQSVDQFIQAMAVYNVQPAASTNFLNEAHEQCDPERDREDQGSLPDFSYETLSPCFRHHAEWWIRYIC
jgi:matrixin